MISKIWRQLSNQRRKRALDSIRRQIEHSGYALDDLTDSEIEAAIPRGKGRIEKSLPLTGKTIYWTLRRLSTNGRELQRRKIKQPPRTHRTGYF